MTKKDSPHPQNRGCGDGQCIMVAHAVYDGVSLLAGTSESSLGSIVAIGGHVAGRTAAKRAAGSIGRPTAMAVAEAATHRGVVVAVTRHGTVAVVH